MTDSLSRSISFEALVIVVTYNSTDLLPELGKMLAEYLEQFPDSRLQIVENSSRAADEDIWNRLLSQVQASFSYHVNPVNSGFSNGVNLAYNLALEKWGEPRLVLLLNPDVRTTAATLASVSHHVGDSIGAAAPLLLSEHGDRVDRGSARRRWSRRRLFAEVAGVPSLTSALLHDSRYVATRPEVFDVDIASGAFIALDNQIFSPGLDTRLPLYLEDQEICHRVHLSGKRVIVDGALTANHIGGASRATYTQGERQVRMMELAEAPAQSLRDWTNSSMLSIRIAVGAGALLRGAIAATMTILTVGAVRWRGQMRLALWFFSWSLGKPVELELK